MKHKWLDEERDIVRRDYDGTNASAYRIAGSLGVTFCAVKGQVSALGIGQDRSRRWLNREIEILYDMITQYRPRTIAKRLNRSINSVVVKSKRLGLSRRFRDGWYTKRDICEILGVDHKWLQRRIDNKGLRAEWNSDIKPSKDGGSYWRIKEEDLRSFILSHCGELQGRNVDLFQIITIVRAD